MLPALGGSREEPHIRPFPTCGEKNQVNPGGLQNSPAQGSEWWGQALGMLHREGSGAQGENGVHEALNRP